MHLGAGMLRSDGGRGRTSMHTEYVSMPATTLYGAIIYELLRRTILLEVLWAQPQNLQVLKTHSFAHNSSVPNISVLSFLVQLPLAQDNPGGLWEARNNDTHD